MSRKIPLYARLIAYLGMALLYVPLLMVLIQSFNANKHGQTWGGFTFDMWLTTHFVTALPGIAIQLALIPSLFVALQRAGIIPRKYEGKKAEETNG